MVVEFGIVSSRILRILKPFWCHIHTLKIIVNTVLKSPAGLTQSLQKSVGSLTDSCIKPWVVKRILNGWLGQRRGREKSIDISHPSPPDPRIRIAESPSKGQEFLKSYRDFVGVERKNYLTCAQKTVMTDVTTHPHLYLHC